MPRARGLAGGLSLLHFARPQLADIVVTSVSRQATRLAEAPASTFILSAAVIRRSRAVPVKPGLQF